MESRLFKTSTGEWFLRVAHEPDPIPVPKDLVERGAKKYHKQLANELTTVFIIGRRIGHSTGMDTVRRNVKEVLGL